MADFIIIISQSQAISHKLAERVAQVQLATHSDIAIYAKTSNFDNFFF